MEVVNDKRYRLRTNYRKIELLLIMNMKIIEKNKIPLIILVTLLALIIYRSAGTNQFKPDAGKWADQTFKKNNFITAEQAVTLPGELLAIDLGDREDNNYTSLKNVVRISQDSVLSRNNLKLIRKHRGTVLLLAEQGSVSASTWMILSQMGIKNIYILSQRTEIEKLKHEFMPDSAAKSKL